MMPIRDAAGFSDARMPWTVVSTLDAFQGRRMLVRSVGDLELLLLRTGGEVIVLHNYCTHLGKSLEGGRVMGGQITCPFHGACFDLRTGAAVSGPAVSPLHRFPARFDGNDIVADLSKKPKNLAAGIAATRPSSGC